MKHHETLVIQCNDIGARYGDVGARCADVARGVTGDICTELPAISSRVFGDCGVGITPQMCNRVTNHLDMGTFFKPDHWATYPTVQIGH